MKKLTTAYFFILSFLFTGITQAQTLDEILQDHFETIGQQKLTKVESIKITGKIVQMGIEIPLLSYQLRPTMMRFEGSFQGQTFIQAYNGTEGWSVNPFTGSLEPQPMGEDELKSMKVNGDIDGMLWNWKEKGYTVTYEGIEAVEGTDCFKIKVVTPEGDTYYQFIDNESNMLIRTNSKELVQGVETESDTYLSNFKLVDGIAFPGKIETKVDGVTAIILVFDNYELNIPIDKTIFNNPKNN